MPLHRTNIAFEHANIGSERRNISHADTRAAVEPRDIAVLRGLRHVVHCGGDLDGFNLSYAVTPGSFEDIVRWVVPELQRRGVYPTDYESGTLRQKLHGRGDRLPAEHRGAGYRV